MIFQITVGASADSNSSRELQKQVIVPEYDIPGNGRIFTPAYEASPQAQYHGGEVVRFQLIRGRS